ncbi:MAG: C40 family peptidase [Syntrophobacteraceae bacterium]
MFNAEIIKDAMEHARVEYPKESCGVVSAGEYHPMENMAADKLSDFEIDAADYLTLELDRGVDAVIHSHPDGVHCPTKADMEGQEASGVPWGIVPVAFGSPMRPFFWGDQLPIAPLLKRQFRMGVFDCYSLVRDWYRLNHNMVLPMGARDPNWWVTGANMIPENYAKAGFVEVEKPEKIGDVIIGKVLGTVENHTGVYIGNGLVLHHLYDRLSRREPLGPWMKFVTRVLRHKDLM